MVGYLVERGVEVRVVDNLVRASPDLLRRLPLEVDVERIDVRDYGELERALDGDVVFHLAALTDAEEAEELKDLYWEVNVAGTENVARIAAGRGMRLVFASTAAVYGELGAPARENVEPRPINYYGLTKLEAERKCLERSDEVDVVVLRLFNVFGERARDGVVKRYLDAVSENRPLIVYGDGGYVRDFVYVGDAVRALYAASLNSSAYGKIINIGSGKPVRIGELAKFISERTGNKVIYREPRKADIRFSLADIALAKKLLGWSPKIELFTWLEATINRMKSV